MNMTAATRPASPDENPVAMALLLEEYLYALGVDAELRDAVVEHLNESALAALEDGGEFEATKEDPWGPMERGWSSRLTSWRWQGRDLTREDAVRMMGRDAVESAENDDADRYPDSLQKNERDPCDFEEDAA